MLQVRKFIMLVMAFSMVACAAKADIFDDIANAIKSGNAKEVSKYFASSIELKTVDKSNVYSKNQAELVLKDFFTANPVKGFSTIHKGSSAKGAKYAIGTMETPNGNFRDYVYVCNKEVQPLIHELSFERE